MKCLSLTLLCACLLLAGIASAQDEGSLSLQATGTISGLVTDATTGIRLGSATVTANPGNHTATSSGSNPFDPNAAGRYTITGLSAGTYELSGSKTGYETKTISHVTVTAGQTTTVDLALTPSAGPEPESTIQVTLTPITGRINQPVTITATSPGATVYYKFWVNGNSYCSFPPEQFNWQVLQDWSTTNTFTWTPTHPGQYVLVVHTNDTPTDASCPKQMGMTYWVTE